MTFYQKIAWLATLLDSGGRFDAMDLVTAIEHYVNGRIQEANEDLNWAIGQSGHTPPVGWHSADSRSK